MLHSDLKIHEVKELFHHRCSLLKVKNSYTISLKIPFILHTMHYGHSKILYV